VLAGRLDIEAIKAAAGRCGASAAEIQHIFELFESVLEFLRQAVLPRQHMLLSYIVARHGIFESELKGRRRSNSIGPDLASVVDTWLTPGATLKHLKFVGESPVAAKQVTFGTVKRPSANALLALIPAVGKKSAAQV
jgi:hypothetical protein